MRRPVLGLAAAAAAVLFLSFATPAQAVTDGVPDGEGHPYVGLMVAFDGEGGGWRCSGTLISPTVYVTAGHCTEGAVEGVQLWFTSDLEPDPAAHGYPLVGEVTGTPYVYPDYDPAAFFTNDLGVVVLDEPVLLDAYGALPVAGQLDSLATKRGKQDVTFTAVGYGLQSSYPAASKLESSALKTRMVAYPKLNQINSPGFTGGFSILLSNNARTGGTCFGDSGGPNFLGTSNVIAGVTSFGLNETCGGTGGVFRLDQADELAWVSSFLD
ncbi:trypsin-like serine protease [Microbacterium hominis]|uniref:Trypsin-like serine protease n=1 Tax=Microbacterium hominis TaxID=162426 RepID=A0A7D4PP54_9MICO|nr:trypsin-like serine protease [Microbacterium hominis]QKJ20815.1 trypsin-like serine protease [Microbacterium hominis]